jgi:hypothetical protein
MRTRAKLCTLIATLVLAGCATTSGDDLGHAVTAPLNDLNLVRDKIPDVLNAAHAAPYALPQNVSCDALSASVVELNEVLGADIDAPPAAREKSLAERGFDELGRVALDAVRHTTESVIPFRNWVRKLSGAERYSREVANAVTAGTARRAFLKGLAAGKGCAPLASKAEQGSQNK